MPLCQSMDEVRANIDRLDREILRLMAERGTYVAEAGRLKPKVTDVVDQPRIEQVVANARALAEQHGLDPAVAEATYRAMIDAFIAMEHKVFMAKAAG
ncbi:chorismate mutase [Azospirillum sp. RWY-5-1]|uniref:chorismate mutase n=1 Tax=Azospirillum oleiclasticum TaxID=2735135 RepID=A0ABX2T4V9_9PROT|nr:chorismate mutase [Azospirillum oleiclasticum]NYZ12205.1 chorismate mutase [Azospirillum oleiclasticum]NYZ19365.1 chorismate mutase [Azospirillum oleiclasticum]